MLKDNNLKRLMEVFDVLNEFLNNQLQWANMTLIDLMAKMFVFITFLELPEKYFLMFTQFYWINKWGKKDATTLVIVDHL